MANVDTGIATLRELRSLHDLELEYDARMERYHTYEAIRTSRKSQKAFKHYG